MTRKLAVIHIYRARTELFFGYVFWGKNVWQKRDARPCLAAQQTAHPQNAAVVSCASGQTWTAASRRRPRAIVVGARCVFFLCKIGFENERASDNMRARVTHGRDEFLVGFKFDGVQRDNLFRAKRETHDEKPRQSHCAKWVFRARRRTTMPSTRANGSTNCSARSTALWIVSSKKTMTVREADRELLSLIWEVAVFFLFASFSPRSLAVRTRLRHFEPSAELASTAATRAAQLTGGNSSASAALPAVSAAKRNSFRFVVVACVSLCVFVCACVWVFDFSFFFVCVIECMYVYFIFFGCRGQALVAIFWVSKLAAASRSKSTSTRTCAPTTTFKMASGRSRRVRGTRISLLQRALVRFEIRDREIYMWKKERELDFNVHMTQYRWHCTINLCRRLYGRCYVCRPRLAQFGSISSEIALNLNRY